MDRKETTKFLSDLLREFAKMLNELTAEQKIYALYFRLL